MSEPTSKLEQKTRELADYYMEENPGVPRQEAKRRVRERAKLVLLGQRTHEAMQAFKEGVQPAWEAQVRALNEALNSPSKRPEN